MHHCVSHTGECLPGGLFTLPSKQCRTEVNEGEREALLVKGLMLNIAEVCLRWLMFVESDVSRLIYNVQLCKPKAISVRCD